MRITLIFLSLLLLIALAYFLVRHTGVGADATKEPSITSPETQDQKVESIEDDFSNQVDSSLLSRPEEDSQPYIVDCTRLLFQEGDSPDETPLEAGPTLEDLEREILEVERKIVEVVESISLDESHDSRLFMELVKESGYYLTDMGADVFDNDSIEDAGVSSLRQLTQEYPQSELAHNLLLSKCSNHLAECSESDDLAATKAAGTNGHIWLQIALARLAREDRTSALDAIQQAAYASSYDEYWHQNIELVVQSLPLDLFQSNDVQFDSAESNYAGFTLATGIAAANFPTYQPITNFCREESQTDAQVAAACIALGERMAEDGKTILSNGMGWAIQKVVYEASGDEESRVRVEQRQESFRSDPIYELGAGASNLMAYDLELFELWWEQLGSMGEYAAMKSLVEEATERSKDPSYNPCPEPAGRG